MTMKFVVTLFFIWVGCSPGVHGARVNEDSVMRGMNFKVYAYEYPPGMSIVRNLPDGNVSYKGSIIDFINYFVDHFQLSLEYVQENASEVKAHGQAFPAVQALVNKEVDFCSFPMLTVTLDRWQIMDFTSLVFQEAFQLLVPWPEEESRLTAVIRPFNITTWIFIFATSFLLVGFLASLPFIYRYWNKREVADNTTHRTDLSFRIFGNAIMYVVAIYTQHGADPRQIGITSRFILRLMLALWLLMTVVLSNLYMGTVTSYLTVNKLKPIPNSLEELTADYDDNPRECLLTMGRNHPVREMLSNSTKAAYQKIVEWTAENPEFSTNVFSEISANIIKHHCSQIGIKYTHSLLISRDYKANQGMCRMTTSRPLTDLTFSHSFQLQKDSPYTPIINQYVLQAHSMGLIKYWIQVSQNGAVNKCKIKDNQENAGKVRPIKLIELSSAFLVLGVGLALSILAFLAERCVAYWSIFSK